MRLSNDPKALQGIYDFYNYFDFFTYEKNILPFGPKLSKINKAVYDALADGSNEELKVKFNIAEYLAAKEAKKDKKTEEVDGVADPEPVIAKKKKSKKAP